MVNLRNREASVAGRGEPGELWEMRAEGQMGSNLVWLFYGEQNAGGQGWVEEVQFEALQ